MPILLRAWAPCGTISRRGGAAVFVLLFVAALIGLAAVAPPVRTRWGRPGTPPAEIVLPPVQADGAWFYGRLRIWLDGVPATGPGWCRCTVDRFVWVHDAGTVWLDWGAVLSVTVVREGVLIHSTAIAPLVVAFPEPWGARFLIAQLAGLA